MNLASGSPLDTIFAMATGAGQAAISVIRLSGPQSAPILRCLAGRLPKPRHASLCRLRDESASTLDHGLVLWMPAPASYTGEDTAELHLHGGRAVAQSVTNALLRAGARPADPGEFTRRAFLAGKMDLLEAEAVADLVRAETDTQRMLALAALDGHSTHAVADWAARIQHWLAYQEAWIDFPDESGEQTFADMQAELHALAAEIQRTLTAAPAGARIRDGLIITITGAPNVGKSSLFNLLSGRDMAMVSPIPGTTRDVLEAPLDIAGIKTTLIDTAGLRDTSDELEAEGVRRARARADDADIILYVTDRTQPPPTQDNPRLLWIENKLDLSPARPGAFGLSAATHQGLATLLDQLTQRVVSLTRTDGDPVLSRARHVASLRDARTALLQAADAPLPELRAEDLRTAMAAIGRLTGQVHTEALLDVIFGAFCIGK